MSHGPIRTTMAGLLLILAGCSAGDAEAEPAETGLPEIVRVGLIPNIAPQEQKAKYGPLEGYLETALDREVELFVASDYAGVVAALASEQIDVAYLGGLTYVQAEEQVDLTPLVTEIDALTGTPQYDSAIIVAADSPVQSTDELVAGGGAFAFGDPASTSGSLYPRIMITDAGATCDTLTLTSCPPLESVVFTGGHDATAQAVLGGTVAGGGVELRILRRLESEGKVPEGALRTIESRRVQGYPWVGRTALGAEALGEVTEAFLTIEDPALLDLLRATDYVQVAPEDYDEIRSSATELGLLTPA